MLTLVTLSSALAANLFAVRSLRRRGGADAASQRLHVLTAGVVLALSAPALAGSAEPPAADGTLAAVSGGLEIVAGIGTASTVGDIGGGMNADDVLGSDGQVELQIGHRVTPHLTLGFYTNAQGLPGGSSDAGDAYTGAFGIEADVHLSPASRIDPWISIGGGVRGMLIDRDDGDYSILAGVELARIQVGADLRINERVAVTPVLGGSATLYGARKDGMQEFAEIADKGINWTVTLGLAGRFNLFGKEHGR